MGPGDKAKFVDAVDRQMADGVKPLYTLDLVISLSPEKKVKCGAIFVFKMNSLGHQKEYDLFRYDEKVAREIQQSVDQSTEEMAWPPEYFKETEGRWLSWAIARTLELYDGPCKGHAILQLKCPMLGVWEKIDPTEVVRRRSDPRELFKTLFDCDILLAGGFEYDPWTEAIHKGVLGVEAAKR